MKNRIISLRATEDEYNIIKEISDNLNISKSDYIMSKVFNRDSVVTPIVMATLENIKASLKLLSEEIPVEEYNTFSKEVDTLWRMLKW